MAVDPNSYGSEVGIERLIGDMVVGRDFGAGTTPTTTQVEAEIDAAAADLNRELDAFGYVAPVVVGDDPIAHAFLVTANNYGAAATLLGTLPPSAFNPAVDPEAEVTSRMAMYQNRFSHALKVIRQYRLNATMATSRFGNMAAGARTNDDGEVNKPLMKRLLHESDRYSRDTEE